MPVCRSSPVGDRVVYSTDPDRISYPILEDGRDLHAECRENENRECPEIPCSDESTEFAEANGRPLIEAALERHQPIEIDHDGSLWQVEHRHRSKPEHHMAVAEHRCGADPCRTNDEHDLREHERRQAELFPKPSGVLLDVSYAFGGSSQETLVATVARRYWWGIKRSSTLLALQSVSLPCHMPTLDRTLALP